MSELFPDYLDGFESKESAHSLSYQLVKSLSLFSFFYLKLPIGTRSLVIQILMFTGVIVFTITLFRFVFVRRKKIGFCLTMFNYYGLGGFLLFYSIFTSVFGDGYVEPAKHAFIAILGMSLQFVALIFICISSILSAGIVRRLISCKVK